MSNNNAGCSTNTRSTTRSGKGGGPRRTTVEHQQLPPRPKLCPFYPSAEVSIPPVFASGKDKEAEPLPLYVSGLNLAPHGRGAGWVSVITASAYAPMQSWLTVMQNLIRHPERNSSNILRADILAETPAPNTNDAVGDDAKGWKKQWTTRRALLPRRPNLDWRMEQDCTLYYRYQTQSGRGDEAQEHGEEMEVKEAVVVYTPLIGAESHPKMTLSTPETTGAGSLGQPPPREECIPFYHPKVRALAFHFCPSPSLPVTGDGNADTVYGQLGISLIPFPTHPSEGRQDRNEASESSFPPTHRLSRVGLSLLTTLHMHTWGDLHSYQKRVYHDQIVPRELNQNVYLALKSRYASELIAGWAEATDATKHVFEEMGIAAFLIALWSFVYPNTGKDGGDEGWKKNVKFVDVGCGNGLLTYILSQEGFDGIGFDMRSRKSWPQYTALGARLEQWTFDPSSLISPSSDNPDESHWSGAWLLGNHADELTPWLPVLATHHNAAGFINLPCCYYSLDSTRDFPLLLKSGGVSRNEQYLAYVSDLHTMFGWLLELEPLRIPSTKNWCFVGRTRIDTASGDGSRKKVEEAVQQALASGWAARTTPN